MKCDRLISLIKSWYIKVQEEAMAPARMVAFMEKHISQCEECLADPDVKKEADKIREIVLPPSKALKPRVDRDSIEDAADFEDVDDEIAEDDDEVADIDEEENDDDDDDDEDEDDFGPDIMDEDDEI